MKPTVLVVDDEAPIRFALRALLEDDGIQVLEAADAERALALVDEHPRIGLVVTDLRMPGIGGMGLLSRFAQRQGVPPTVVITAHGDERVAVEAMKAGALDYLAKPFNETELLRVVHRNLQTARLAKRVQSLEAVTILQRTMVFESDAMHRVAELVHRVGPRDVSVLVTGESGTGKELVARALAQCSGRSHGPWVPFSCATLGRELAEAELFGHVEGAFTGARRARPGLFQEANGGTLFLDEVGELAPTVQASLLRVLQERQVRPIGSPRASAVDVRIIAATNRDLERDANFRDDLFYRLNVVEIHLPPLRARPADVVPLARDFARRAAERFELGPVRLSPGLERYLQQQTWPGNVRQLKHQVERLVALSTAEEIGIPDEAATGAPQGEPGLKAQVDAFEAEVLRDTLAQTEGNRSEAARRLQVSRMTLVTKIKKYGL